MAGVKPHCSYGQCIEEVAAFGLVLSFCLIETYYTLRELETKLSEAPI